MSRLCTDILHFAEDILHFAEDIFYFAEDILHFADAICTQCTPCIAKRTNSAPSLAETLIFAMKQVLMTAMDTASDGLVQGSMLSCPLEHMKVAGAL